MFQFHSGSIKSRERARTDRRIEQFQFHSGSIKRPPGTAHKKTTWPRFNSIVVRLKVVLRMPWRTSRSGFNSIVVRLKAPLCFIGKSSSATFQFHSGSIKRSKCLTQQRWVRGFNSIVVRLKERTAPTDRQSDSCFNSIVVRLKGSRWLRSTKHNRSFNSIVVRLKETMRRAWRHPSKQFQFHSGSIKSRPWAVIGLCGPVVSIP